MPVSGVAYPHRRGRRERDVVTGGSGRGDPFDRERGELRARSRIALSVLERAAATPCCDVEDARAGGDSRRGVRRAVRNVVGVEVAEQLAGRVEVVDALRAL